MHRSIATSYRLVRGAGTAALEASRLQALGPEKAALPFPKDHTHTSAEGADLKARDVAQALRDTKLPLASFLKAP